MWKKEKQIQQVKTERKISYPDARRIVQETSCWSLPGAKPGRSSANKTAVEIVDGVAIQKKTAPVRSASVSSRGKKSPVRAPPAPKEPTD